MKILVFNDYCCVGNCALKANISVLTQNGYDVFGVPTRMFSAHMGYEDFFSFEMPHFSDVVEKIIGKQNIDAVYVGFVDIKEQFEIIKNFLKGFKGKVVLDPILGDNGLKYSGATRKQIEFYKELLKFSDVVTPNLTESILLTDYKKEFSKIEEDDVEVIGKKLLKMGAKQVLIKSFIKNDMMNTLYMGENKKKWFAKEKIDVKICGTGDVFSSLVTSELLKEKKLENSIDNINDLLFKNIQKQEKHCGLNEISLWNFKHY